MELKRPRRILASQGTGCLPLGLSATARPLFTPACCSPPRMAWATNARERRHAQSQTALAQASDGATIR